jgi:hypothetical protein
MRLVVSRCYLPAAGIISGGGNCMNLSHSLLFAFFFLAVWVAASLLVSLLGGWNWLAQRYRYAGTFTGTQWSFRSGQMRWFTNYNNCLTVGASPEGLFLSILFLFRPGHPPLLIPWQDISVSANKRSILWLGSYVEMRLGGPFGVRFRIRARLADQLREAAGGSWPVEAAG